MAINREYSMADYTAAMAGGNVVNPLAIETPGTILGAQEIFTSCNDAMTY